MDMCMIVATTIATTITATIDWASYGPMALAILMTAAGLGFIIFVHELGHFAVAKWCGVKCDKFMIGFDIAGYKIGRQWGETYYGIGILPLGGYVKMMGQDDDPRMTAEQIAESKATGDTMTTREIVGPTGEKIDVDARSYLAKTVPQRMAIISAGVIMNVIFAFLFALFAFRIGVPAMPCIVSMTDPGAPAWVAGLMPGDQITRIGDIDDPWFFNLQNEVTLSGRDESVEFGIAGRDVPLLLKPSRARRKIAQIGITSPVSLELHDKSSFFPYSPAEEIAQQLPGGAKIVEVAGESIDSYSQLVAALATQLRVPLEITLEKEGERSKATLPVNHRESVGLVTKMGPISAVQTGSPAEKAGLKPGDQIVALNGKPIGVDRDGKIGWNPNTLGEQLTTLGQSSETVVLDVIRASESEAESISVSLRPVTWIEHPFSPKSPASAPALGIAYLLTSQVEAIVPGSPASQADLQPGDQLLSAQLVMPDESQDAYKGWEKPLEFSEKQPAWAYVLEAIQDTPPGSQLELKVKREGKEEPVEVLVDIVSTEESFDPQRGLALIPFLETRYGSGLGEQASMAWYETKRSLTSVYRFLRRLINNDIPATALGGPITIARASYSWALSGPGKLLLFLTLISANLAVINFLPIPLLDGGHMVFLIYEGIFRRPANEKFVMAMHMVGFALIICLMLFVFGLDLGLIPRNL